MRSTTCCRSRPRSQCAAAGVIAAAALIAASGLWRAHAADPSQHHWQPEDGDAIVAAAGSPIDRQLREMHRDLRTGPRDADLAAAFARAAMQRYAVVGDARLIGRVEAALTPWLEMARPPIGIWRLRGRLLQNRHRFADAGDDLEALLAAYPEDPEARLLAADARRRSGALLRARDHCLAMGLNGYLDHATLCAAELRLTLGDFHGAEELASSVIDRAMTGSRTAMGWAFAVRAESAVGRGDFDRAIAAYRASLAASPALPVRLGLADALLEAENWTAAGELLARMPDVEPVLLRQAILVRRTNRSDRQRILDQAEASYAGQPEHPQNEDHYRERALYFLFVMERPELAVDAARKNWEQQKGWEDGELLLRAAQAARRPDVALPVIEWRRNHLEEDLL